VSAKAIAGLVRLAKVRLQGAQSRLVRAQSDLRNAEQALAEEERKLAEFLARAQERRAAMLHSLTDGPQSPAKLARLPLLDAVIKQQIDTAGDEVKSARETVESAKRTIEQCQSEVAMRLQKQQKVEIAYDQLVILDLKGAEVAEEMMD
jgi:hypothetical protein